MAEAGLPGRPPCFSCPSTVSTKRGIGFHEMARRRPAWEPNPETMLEDLLALVEQQRADTWERRHAALSKRRAEAKARSQAIGERRWAEQVAARRAKQAPGLGRRLVDRFVRVMEPGDWYARHENAGR